jgi:hypothetical protein
VFLESFAPVSDANASQTNDTLYLVVRENNTVRYTKSFVVGQRGQMTRLDFGQIDSDHNGLMDDWELRYFGALGQDPNADPDGDTLTHLQEMQGGTDPLIADLRHPADLNTTNNLITIHELTSYALAWKTGQPWPIAPTNIDLNYVTRGGYLWKNGEEYRLDLAVATNAPLWWVPGHQIRTAALRSVTNTEPLLSRELPVSFQASEILSVTLNVTPGPAVSAYAVEEQVPAGWEASAISDDGQFEPANRVIRWGLFLDPEARALTYRLRPTSSVEETEFRGAGSFDGALAPVAGRTTLVRAGFVRFRSVVTELRNAGLRCALQGEPARTYVIEASPDLVQWHEINRLPSDPDGRCEFFAGDASGASQFYRARIASELR